MEVMNNFLFVYISAECWIIINHKGVNSLQYYTHKFVFIDFNYICFSSSIHLEIFSQPQTFIMLI